MCRRANAPAAVPKRGVSHAAGFVGRRDGEVTRIVEEALWTEVLRLFVDRRIAVSLRLECADHAML
jgi:hypothetical protein